MNRQNIFTDHALGAAMLRGLRAVSKVEETLAHLVTSGAIDSDSGLILSLEVEDARREILACAKRVAGAREQLAEAATDQVQAAASRFYCSLDDAEKGKIYMQARRAGYSSATTFIRDQIAEEE